MKRKDGLTRAVLLGIAAGAVATLAPQSAEANTLTEYKAQLAAADATASTQSTGEVINVTGSSDYHLLLDSSSNVSEYNVNSTGWTSVTIKPGTKLVGTKITAGAAGNESADLYLAVNDENSWVNTQKVPSNSDAVDLTESYLNVSGTSGGISIINGTNSTKAQNIYGGSGGKIYVGGDPNDSDLQAAIKGYTNKATLKLVGDTKFNSVYNTNGSEYIYITDRGVLEAESSQIFTAGLGTDGETISPESVRSDADSAINFKAGTLLLDDENYNEGYLTKAQELVKATDGGSTVVEMVSTSTKVESMRGLDDITDSDKAGIFSGINVGKPGFIWGGLASDIKSAIGDILNASRINLVIDKTQGICSITVDGKTLNLGSAINNQQLITTDGATPSEAVPLGVTNKGTLALGTGASNSANTLNAAVTLDAGTTLKTLSGTQTVSSVTATSGSTISVADGATLKSTAVSLDGTTVNIAGTLDATVTSATGSTIYVGDSSSAGTLIADSGSDLTGATIYMDPVWKSDGTITTITDASTAAIAGTTANYNLVVGQNSVASLGTSSTAEAVQAFADSGLTWGDGTDEISAALYLAAPITLASGYGLTVDGTQTETTGYTAPTANTATFAGNSLLMVDASSLSGSAALTAADTTNSVLTVDKTARLYLANAQVGTTYTIASGFADTTNAAGWYTDNANIILNKLLTTSAATTGASTGITLAFNEKSDVYQQSAAKDVLKSVVNAAELKKTSSYAGASYIAMATDGLLSTAQSVALINNGFNPLEATGATASNLKTANTFADLAQSNLSLLTMPGDKDEHGIWAKYPHIQNDVNGMYLGGSSWADYSGKFNGVTVGFDLPRFGSYESGIAISYGKGSSSAIYQHGNQKLGGVSYYGSVKSGENNLLLDAGIYHASNETTGLIKADTSTNIFTLGVTDEYRVNAGTTTIVPHIGLRYTYLGAEGYDGTYGGQKAFHYEPGNKHVFTLPIGVGFMNKFSAGGFKYNLAADLAYVPVLGGRTNDMRVSIPGLGAYDSFSYEVTFPWNWCIG